MTVGPHSLLEALDALEDSDSRRLAWGLVDETWTEPELVDRLASAIPDSDPRQVIEELIAHGLIVEVPSTWPVQYRTRMAEAVRLFAKLRQLLPVLQSKLNSSGYQVTAIRLKLGSHKT